ncbi:hypothetical protein Tco_0550197 [Tanacetum coccineum]
MTMSSNKELVTPYEEPKQVLHSARKLFKTTSLDYSSSLEFDLFSDLEDQFEEVAEAMGEPSMEEYMTKTREYYGLGIARPKIDEKAKFELKGQFLKNYVIILSVDQIIKMQMNTLKMFLRLCYAIYEGCCAKKAIQDMVDHSQKWHNGTSTRTRNTDTFDGLAAILAQLNNLGRKIKKLNQSIIRFPNRLIDDSYKEMGVLKELMLPQINSKESATNLKRLLKERPRMGYQIKASMNVNDSAILEDSLPPKEKDPGSFTIPCHTNNICFEKALADLGASISVMPYSTFTNLDFVVLDMPKDIKVTLILGRPFLSIAHSKIDVFKRKFTLRVGDDKIVFRSDNPTNNIIKRVYALGLRERMELDLEARLLGETLNINRSLDPTYGDYIKLNDLNEPLELRRHQLEDLGLAIEDG